MAVRLSPLRIPSNLLEHALCFVVRSSAKFYAVPVEFVRTPLQRGRISSGLAALQSNPKSSREPLYMPCHAITSHWLVSRHCEKNTSTPPKRKPHSSSSASSSTLGGFAGAAVDVIPGADVPETAASRAALRLCVVPSFSAALVMSTLGRAFFNGLPTRASAGTSDGACTALGGCRLGGP